MRKHFIFNAFFGVLTFIFLTFLPPQNSALADVKSNLGICSELAPRANRSRANALISLRNTLPEGYSLRAYKSGTNQHPHYLLIVNEKGYLPSVLKTAEDKKNADAHALSLAMGVGDLDSNIVADDRLPFGGTHVIAELAAPKTSMIQNLLTVADGLLRIVPLGVLLASPSIFGMTGTDLVFSPQFLLTNFGVMLASWYVFPELVARTTPSEWKAYHQSGDASPGVATILAGSPIERRQLGLIVDDLITKVHSELEAVSSHPGSPVLAVLVPDTAAVSLSTALSRQGYTNLSLEDLVQTLR